MDGGGFFGLSLADLATIAFAIFKAVFTLVCTLVFGGFLSGLKIVPGGLLPRFRFVVVMCEQRGT